MLTHHHTQVNGHSIHYVTAGKGTPLLLLHGWPQTWYAWRYIIPRLSEEYTVIAPDLTGLGDSSAPPAFTPSDVAETMFLLMRQLGYTTHLLAGHDWGGNIAYLYATKHPASITRLAILDIGVMDRNLENRPLLARAGKNLWWFPFHMTPELPEQLIAGREHIYLNWFYQNATFNKTPFEDISEYLRCYSAPGAMGRSFTYYRNILHTIDINSKAPRLTIPVLALGGDHSFGAYPAHSFSAVADNVQGGIIPDCGHYIAEEQPAALLQYLFEFFR
jgi:pimeloyl-ACP methyl ester carboxylesterase